MGGWLDKQMDDGLMDRLVDDLVLEPPDSMFAVSSIH